MADVIRDYWSFLPYFALLSFLAVMSAREGTVRKKRDGGGAN